MNSTQTRHTVPVQKADKTLIGTGIDKTLAHDGFYISDTTDFDEKLISLRGKAVVNADNISIFDISSDVLNVDGEHNGENYVAHTFYVKTKRVIPLITDIH